MSKSASEMELLQYDDTGSRPTSGITWACKRCSNGPRFSNNAPIGLYEYEDPY